MKPRLLIGAVAAVAMAGAIGWALTPDRTPQAMRVDTHGGHGGHGYGEMLKLEDLGGAFTLADVDGRPVRSTDLEGGWTLMFFGYSRCTEACALAAPTLAATARRLQSEGIRARAVFVDIDAPAAAGLRPRRDELRRAVFFGPHAGHEEVDAARALSRKFDGDLLVLTGTRAQLSHATTLFRVNREHMPPRPKERGHSINHDSRVYLLDSDGRVVAWFAHDLSPQVLAAEVRRRAEG